MTKQMMASAVILASLGVSVALMARPVQADSKAPGKAAVVWTAGELKWADNPAIKGAKMAVLWGDPKTGPYGALKTLPAGTSIALHTHSHDQNVITISGTIVLTMEGSPAKDLSQNAYAFIPGRAKHSAACKAGAECTYFEEGAGASDLQFVEGAKK